MWLVLLPVQDQELPLSMETEVVEEIVGGAVARVTELHPKYEIDVISLDFSEHNLIPSLEYYGNDLCAYLGV